MSFIPCFLHMAGENEIRGHYKRLHLQQNQTKAKRYIKHDKTINDLAYRKAEGDKGRTRNCIFTFNARQSIMENEKVISRSRGVYYVLRTLCPFAR